MRLACFAFFQFLWREVLGILFLMAVFPNVLSRVRKEAKTEQISNKNMMLYKVFGNYVRFRRLFVGKKMEKARISAKNIAF